MPVPLFKVSLNIVLTDKSFNQCLWVHENFVKHWNIYINFFVDIEIIEIIGSLNELINTKTAASFLEQ